MNNRAGESSVRIVETSPRDGLPYLKGITTDEKIDIINKLSETGIKSIDCVSFIHPALFPKYADAEKVVTGIKDKSDIVYSGMVPNEMGCRRALTTKINEISFLLSMNDDYNAMQKLKPLRETLNKLPALCEMAISHGKRIRAHITVFESPAEMIPSTDLLELIIKLNHLGVKEISLMDLTSRANPIQVKNVVRAILDLNLSSELAVHFHNNRNAGIANCMAAYEAGVRIFDTSLAGLSSPHPGGSVETDFIFMNVPTEDFVHLFEDMGIHTGVNLDRLTKCVELVEKYSGRLFNGEGRSRKSRKLYQKRRPIPF